LVPSLNAGYYRRFFGRATMIDVLAQLLIDPIQSSMTMILGAFSVVVVLAVTVASHQRP
jgi:c-di-GMP-related signal transduction protein